ncbi:hypothetical protein ACFLZQ_08095 [Thermodesulfobacteriota bacterium]
MSSAEEKFNNFIVEQLSIDNDEALPDESFIDTLDTDTLELVKLIMATGIRKKKMNHSYKVLSK